MAVKRGKCAPIGVKFIFIFTCLNSNTETFTSEPLLHVKTIIFLGKDPIKRAIECGPNPWHQKHFHFYSFFTEGAHPLRHPCLNNPLLGENSMNK